MIFLPTVSVCLCPALRDNRIELVRASWSELTISISDVLLSDEGMYTCSLFTMPVRTAKAYLTVLGKSTLHQCVCLIVVVQTNFAVDMFLEQVTIMVR